MKLLSTIICLCSLIYLHGTDSGTAKGNLQDGDFVNRLPDHQFKGNHFLASYSNCDHAALINLEALQEAMLDAAKKSGATILDSVKYEFDGGGFTMVILLSESHASIHTYPEFNACFIDLFTCGDKCSSDNFDQALRAYLKPEEVSYRNLIRDAEIKDVELRRLIN